MTMINDSTYSILQQYQKWHDHAAAQVAYAQELARQEQVRQAQVIRAVQSHTPGKGDNIDILV
jgi:hypothetical protein